MGKRKKTTDRAKGRPPRGAAPALPAADVDRLLVFGEPVTCKDGESQTIAYPSYSELAHRYEVSPSLIAKYSKDHNCLNRREEAQARIEAQVDKKLIEMRATAIALSKEDELRIIDSYLLQFEQALADGRVRMDNPGDFNTMLRLKNFVGGGADSRHEVHTSISLVEIQARHKQSLRVGRDGEAPPHAPVPSALSGMITDSCSTPSLPPNFGHPTPSTDQLPATTTMTPAPHSPEARPDGSAEVTVPFNHQAEETPDDD